MVSLNESTSPTRAKRSRHVVSVDLASARSLRICFARYAGALLYSAILINNTLHNNKISTWQSDCWRGHFFKTAFDFIHRGTKGRSEGFSHEVVP